ncbi:hypothetical protein CRD36_14225 [Paremcibacter congregatus]|uniref:N-acetyltransferase domain-containing protein n=2 Tax=Paremcibacter congregatus TaxID=2043170 RepID=A0A2G4YNU7_9PROT|nr:hypothetical protein CRD36_14225 [Paremcibacter congregatus]QDE25943.1 N-acetyltransferase [Paremcibacter congregatus]
MPQMSTHRSENILLRGGEAADARQIAELINIASRGIELHDWQAELTLAMVADGQNGIDVGAAKVLASEGYNHYSRVRVADCDGRVAAMCLNHILVKKTAAELDSLAPMRRVYADLKQHEPGSFYIDSLACFPAYRGRGLGKLLIEDAFEEAQAVACDRISLLAFEQNAGAMRLYQHMGFEVLYRLPAVESEEIPYGGDVVLMSRDVP